MQETVKAAASYFYANRSVFDAGRLRFQGFAAETQISNEIGGTDMRTTKFNMKDFGLRLRKLRQACGLPGSCKPTKMKEQRDRIY